MLSGNGRHRRPRQAPALLVAAGVTGSAIAIPLLGAGAANAADGDTWDRVAECESGGSWSQNTGNGYYGGLQLTQEDWEAHGGLGFASSADRASRSQQITVAERLLADRGPGAWPTCGLLAGLGGGSGGADAGGSESSGPDGLLGGLLGGGGSGGASQDTPDTPDTPGTPDASGPAGSGGSATGAPDDSASDDSASDGSAGGGQEDGAGESGRGGTPSAGTEAGAGTGSGGSGTGRHRGPGADEDARDGRGAGAPGRHASRDAADSRDAGDDGTYTVRAGDSLWAIADSLGLDAGWPGLYAANRGTVGDDPDLILPGQKLAVQGESGEK
ncbi:MAG TPA: transglycosylase family protein [Streptomyces sp.]|nr:transglycosylase family protein [Streptomyces sp.]